VNRRRARLGFAAGASSEHGGHLNRLSEDVHQAGSMPSRHAGDCQFASDGALVDMADRGRILGLLGPDRRHGPFRSGACLAGLRRAGSARSCRWLGAKPNSTPKRSDWGHTLSANKVQPMKRSWDPGRPGSSSRY